MGIDLAHVDVAPEPGATGLWVAAIMVLVALAMAAIHRAAVKCPQCRAKMTVSDRCVRPATTLAEGLSVKVHHCPKCGAFSETEYRTPPSQTMGGCC
jgi:endogenous inhibitor of DNA gyrase (YacG/DUF329 family)